MGAPYRDPRSEDRDLGDEIREYKVLREFLAELKIGDLISIRPTLEQHSADDNQIDILSLASFSFLRTYKIFAF